MSSGMVPSATYRADAIRSWLESILFERFGHAFCLLPIGTTFVRLRLEGSDAHIDVVADPATFSRSNSDLPCASWDAAAEGWTAAVGKPLPAPGTSVLHVPLIERVGKNSLIHYDILGLTYWMLSRQEEVARTDLDSHRRFPATSSHAFKHDYLERPIVDEWLCILEQVIQNTWPALLLSVHQFSVKVSHDVDSPSRYAFRSAGGTLRAMGGDLLRRRDIQSALLAPWVRLHSNAALHRADPYNTFDWIMDLSERHGLKSAFYFICGRTDADKDADYEPEHPAIRQLMRRIHARGHEVGLHPSYNSYRSPKTIAAEAARLRRVASEEGIEQAEWGGRMHYLRWEHPATLQAWEQAGMTYDSTLSYADRPGFRCGTCFEYPAFDPMAGHALELRIRPLIAMECTVISPSYMGLGTGDTALTKFRELKDTCKAVGGCFTLLWHNSQFDSAVARLLYEDVLTDCVLY